MAITTTRILVRFLDCIGISPPKRGQPTGWGNYQDRPARKRMHGGDRSREAAVSASDYECMAFRRSPCGKDVPWKSQIVQVTDSRPPTRQQVLGCCLKRTDQPGSKGAVMPAVRWPRPSLSWVLQTSF